MIRKTLNNIFYSRKFMLPKLDQPRPYIVGSGWWCDGSGTHAGAQVDTNPSTNIIRKKEFFRIWHHFVDRYTSPEKIVIIDSASPIRPDLPDDPRIEFLSLSKNWGHFRDCDIDRMCGVERAHLGCAFYAFINDCDLVYIEQDCIVIGENWLDYCKSHMRRGKIMYGDGVRTPQPVQQSLAIIDWEFIPEFCSRLIDQYNLQSEHMKGGGIRGKHNPEWRWKHSFGKCVDFLPFGYGRQRPINFNDEYLYAQHWTEDELRDLVARENVDTSLMS